jgi:hypothetical protein
VRLLIFVAVLLATSTTADTVAIKRFADTHAPAYALREIREMYAAADAYTKAFIRETWPRAQDEMMRAGIPPADQPALFRIILKESTWNHTAKNPNSSAYGYCGTMLSDHEETLAVDFTTNPVAQLKWCHAYAMNRYGDYQAALLHHRRKNWW